MNTYTVGKLAELSGTTIRTIQYYDKINLLVAKRKRDSNLRYYTDQDLVQLQQILFYKKLGLSLTEIKEHCLNYGSKRDLKHIFVRQKELLFKKEMELKTNLAIIDAILSTMHTDHYNLYAIMEFALKSNQYVLTDYANIDFDPEIEAVINERDVEHQEIIAVYWKWKRLLLEAFLLKRNEIKPESPAGYRFGKKWAVFVQMATDNDPETIAAYTKAYEQRELWPEEDLVLMDFCNDFIDQAYHYFQNKEDLR